MMRQLRTILSYAIGVWLISLDSLPKSMMQSTSVPPGTAQELDVRLVGGNCTAEGQVEIYHASTWGTICPTGIGETEADIICRSLPGEYDGGYVIHRLGVGDKQVWLTDLVCFGSFESVSQCIQGLSQPAWGNEDCSNDMRAWVRCTKDGLDDSACVEHDADEVGELKIVGNCHFEGRLLVADSHHLWGTVCSIGFDDLDAAVACRQLKYATGWSNDPPYGLSDEGMTSVMVDLDCHGNETSLSQCPYKAGVKCPGRTAGVTCSTVHNQRRHCNGDLVNDREGDLRLANPSQIEENAGVLQLFYHGHWGDVCDARGNSNIETACKLIGYSSGQRIDPLFVSDKSPLRLYFAGCVSGSAKTCRNTVMPIESPCELLWVNCYDEPPHPCDSNPCKFGGSCFEGREGDMHCHCAPHYAGQYCDIDLGTPCRSNPCLHNGSCLAGANWYICKCPSLYAGHNCQLKSPSIRDVHNTVTIVAGILGALLVILMFGVAGVIYWMAKKQSVARRFPGMQRLDEELSVIGEHNDDVEEGP